MNNFTKAVASSIRALLGNFGPVKLVPKHGNSGADLLLVRENLKSGTLELQERVRCGPNHFHAFITHPDNSITH